jgi:DNA recombination protein RmuC
MQIILAGIAAGLTVVVVVLLLLLSRRSATPAAGTSPEIEVELRSLRDQKADLDRRLAVEEVKSARVSELERELARCQETIERLNEQRNEAERDCAIAKNAGAHLQTAMDEVKGRLVAAEQRLEAALRESAELQSRSAEQSVTLANSSERIETLSRQIDQASADARAAQQEISQLRISLSTVRETLDQERRQFGEKLGLLTEARERMSQEFKSLASDVMKAHGETFSSQNREQIEAILAPLREKLGDFQLGLQTAQSESAKERATLAEQIRQLSERSAALTSEASSLTRALKGEAQTQGAWGEMVLNSILERSGLREGEEYVIQENHITEEGSRRRPDVLVKLPGGQRIVIDSKLSISAFHDYVNCAAESERADHLKRHMASIRSHIKELSTKEYHSVVGGELDYVVMFIPIEGALAAALQEDPGLTAEAVESNVAIATPTTLMIALRTVSNVWQVERRNRNAEMIAQKAGRLYDKFVGFLDDMTVVGNRMNQARASYDDAMAKLSSGRGNIVGQIANLKELGAKASKSIPSALLEEEGEPAGDPPAVLTGAGV